MPDTPSNSLCAAPYTAPYTALACYRFTPIQDPHAEVVRHNAFFENRGCTGRIYISSEGINAQLSGPTEQVCSYQEFLVQDPRFHGIHFNMQPAQENLFARMTIKYREQLVALDRPVDLSRRGTPLSPHDFCTAIASPQEKLVLDVRNNYETAIGHFEGAELPPYQYYREFPAYAEALRQRVDPETTPVFMCCTGGIRCELFSALLIELGFKQVFQLQGGLLNYGAQVGSAHFRGKVFVFDDRLAIPMQSSAPTDEAEAISHCQHCSTPCDVYYNCANMHCNELFLSCPRCLEVQMGCCGNPECTSSSHRRPLDARTSNKPFRRKHLCSL